MNHNQIPAYTLDPVKRDPAPAPAERSHTPNFINDIAAGRVELPTIPRVVHQVVAVLRDPNADARRIGDALSRDPVLSAKVLRLANSSFFAGQRSVASIEAAVVLIGTQGLNRLIVASGISASFKAIPGIDLPAFWRDSLMAATAAHRLAPRLGADAEEAYVCGLLHATGHLILCHAYPEIADAMFTGFALLRGAELAAIEIECFGIDHPTAGALWVDTLGFPQSVADTIRQALQAPAATDKPLDLSLRGACALTAAVARQDAVEAAAGALPANVRSGCVRTDGQPDAAFVKLYEMLRETQPVI